MILNRKRKQPRHPIITQGQPDPVFPQSGYNQGARFGSDHNRIVPQFTDIIDQGNQFSMELKKSRWEWFFKFKGRLAKLSSIVEALPFWRNTNTVLAVLSSLTVVTVIFYSLGTSYSSLQEQIPVFFKQSSRSWQLVDKEILIPIPIILGASLILLIKFSSDVYRFDRRLSFMINTAVIIFNILGIIAFYQLLSLSLVY